MTFCTDGIPEALRVALAEEWKTNAGFWISITINLNSSEAQDWQSVNTTYSDSYFSSCVVYHKIIQKVSRTNLETSVLKCSFFNKFSFFKTSSFCHNLSNFIAASVQVTETVTRHWMSTPGRQEGLLTKDSYIHIDVSNSPFTELGEVLLEKRQDVGHICQWQ